MQICGAILDYSNASGLHPDTLGGLSLGMHFGVVPLGRLHCWVFLLHKPLIFNALRRLPRMSQKRISTWYRWLGWVQEDIS
jgi:hypothetical protein